MVVLKLLESILILYRGESEPRVGFTERVTHCPDLLQPVSFSTEIPHPGKTLDWDQLFYRLLGPLLSKSGEHKSGQVTSSKFCQPREWLLDLSRPRPDNSSGQPIQALCPHTRAFLPSPCPCSTNACQTFILGPFLHQPGRMSLLDHPRREKLPCQFLDKTSDE